MIPLSVNLIEWAQKIVFVDQENYNEAIKTFEAVGYLEDLQQKSVILQIPDKYEAFDHHLVSLFETFFDEWESK